MKENHKNGDWYKSDDDYWTATISVYDDRLHDGIIRQEREQRIASIPNGIDDDSVRIVNLICAAPDLLEALQDLFIDCMACDYNDGFNTSPLAKKVRAAIAKATGGAA